MPPFCCGGRRCAADLSREHQNVLQKLGKKASDELLTTDVDYVRPLALKFYARHDWPYFHCTKEEIYKMRVQCDPKSLDMAAKLSPPRKSLEGPAKYVIKHATATPITTNQVYGWYHDRAFYYPKTDRGVFIFPRQEDPLIKQILRDRLANSLDR
ncbi:uncharacterized protein LOC124460159 [Drosophila willistoni]|uniref:uncharacterized protein LOC124460159 n=1 Tax=Drosophila willistoni TaxID=7260 RepID=UPI00017D74AA|nr:uncharacterized protein LOC124460159 [Drosophila willistoni]